MMKSDVDQLATVKWLPIRVGSVAARSKASARSPRVKLRACGSGSSIAVR